jgi:predicted AAA+ superfamily ATPase
MSEKKKMLQLWLTKLENRFNVISDRRRLIEIEEKEILEELCKARKELREMEKDEPKI